MHELGLILNKLTDSFHVEHPSEEDIKEIFTELDRNGDGKINQKEFDELINEVVHILEEDESKRRNK